MRLFTMLLAAAAILAGCEPAKEAVPQKEQKQRPLSEVRLRLDEGLELTRSEIQEAGKVFGGQIQDLTLAEAKECRVGLYIKSRHFNSGDPTAFTNDFSQDDREQSEVNRMTFAYKGFDEAVRNLEIQRVRDEMSDAPESVQKQILREGGFHKSVVGLARCKQEEMTAEDSQVVYFQIYCAAAGITRRNQQYRMQAKMETHCNQLADSFIDTGAVNPSLLENTPMR